MHRGYTKSWRKKYESKSASRGLLYLGAMDWLVGNANWADAFVDGEKICRGQILVGRQSLSRLWNVSEQTVRTVLKNLEKDEFLTSTSTNKGSVLTVLNYSTYQPDEDVNQPAHQPTPNQRLTTDQPLLKNNKNNKNSSNNKITFDYEGDKQLHGIDDEQLKIWTDFYPALDLRQELCKASAWLDANRKNRKINIKQFLVNWFNRAQGKAPVARSGSEQRSVTSQAQAMDKNKYSEVF